MKRPKGIAEKLRAKAKSRSGESIAETLIALLISCAGLVMLIFMLTGGINMTAKSKDTLSDYYDKNNNVAAQDDGGKEVKLTLTVKDPGFTDHFSSQDFETLLFTNDTISRTPVYSYRQAEGGDGP